MHVIQIVVDPPYGPEGVAGQYIESYDPSSENERGVGTIELTADVGKAKRFKDFMEATSFWKQESLTVPVRPDGKPNRPLTAFSVTFENVAE